MGFERSGGEQVFDGELVTVRVERFRHEDGGETTREVVGLPGAAAVVAHDGARLYLVAQPREAVGEEALLELPAGTLDKEDEEPLETAQRELREEIGKGARRWEHLTSYFSSPGAVDEEVHLFLATDLYDDAADSGEEERIDVRTVPLAELDDVIAGCRDAKTIIGLMWLRAYRAGGG